MSAKLSKNGEPGRLTLNAWYADGVAVRSPKYWQYARPTRASKAIGNWIDRILLFYFFFSSPLLFSLVSLSFYDEPTKSELPAFSWTHAKRRDGAMTSEALEHTAILFSAAAVKLLCWVTFRLFLGDIESPLSDEQLLSHKNGRRLKRPKKINQLESHTDLVTGGVCEKAEESGFLIEDEWCWVAGARAGEWTEKEREKVHLKMRKLFITVLLLGELIRRGNYNPSLFVDRSAAGSAAGSAAAWLVWITVCHLHHETARLTVGQWSVWLKDDSWMTFHWKIIKNLAHMNSAALCASLLT